MSAPDFLPTFPVRLAFPARQIAHSDQAERISEGVMRKGERQAADRQTERLKAGRSSECGSQTIFSV
jgi:hypothetical protein